MDTWYDRIYRGYLSIALTLIFLTVGFVAIIPHNLPSAGGVVLPADHYRHEGYAREWWFMCGQMKTEGGSGYFTSSVYPNGTAYLNIIMPDERRLFVSHGMFRSSPSEGVLGTEIAWLNFYNRPGSFDIHYADDNVSFSAVHTAEGGPIYFGDGGIVDFPLLGRAWTYSVTGVPMEGSLSMDGREIKFTGVMELERLWGNFDYSHFQSWHWFMLYEEERGTAELTVYVIDGETYVLGGTYPAGGSVEVEDLGNGTWALNWDGERRVIRSVEDDAWVSGVLWDGACTVEDENSDSVPGAFAIVEIFIPGRNSTAQAPPWQ